jgi:hypothetical protein
VPAACIARCAIAVSASGRKRVEPLIQAKRLSRPAPKRSRRTTIPQ